MLAKVSTNVLVQIMLVVLHVGVAIAFWLNSELRQVTLGFPIGIVILCIVVGAGFGLLVGAATPVHQQLAESAKTILLFGFISLVCIAMYSLWGVLRGVMLLILLVNTVIISPAMVGRLIAYGVFRHLHTDD